jgi:hypothetical protein
VCGKTPRNCVAEKPAKRAILNVGCCVIAARMGCGVINVFQIFME